MIGRIGRFAGPKLAALGKQLGRNYKTVFAPGGKVDYTEIGMSLLPDLMYGGMTAAMTPGDAIDKAIAFGTDVALGGVSSGAMRGALGARGTRGKDMLGMAVEMGTPMVTMNAIHPVSNGLIRMKHGGKSPLDIEMEQQDQAYRAGVIQQVMQELAAHGVRV